MIQLYDKDKNKIAGLINYSNLSIESFLESGDKTLSFSYLKNSKFYSDIEEECYIRTKENEYVIKELNIQKYYTEFKCILNLEELEGKAWERFESMEQAIDKSLRLALAGTGWIVGKCNIKKKRTIKISDCSSLDIIKEIKKTYRCDLVFNTLTKTIDIYEHLGEGKGTYFIGSLNLKSLNIQGHSYDFCTRLIPIGKDGLTIESINNGEKYIENYQYSNKIKTKYWKDDRYTISENLKKDAEAKLKELSKPCRSYTAEIINLAKLNNKYKNILDYKLGDTITLISKDDKFKDKQRIVKIIEYPNQHEKDTVELSNTKLSFEDIQTQFKEAVDTVDNITTDNGTVDGTTIDSIKSNQISDLKVEVAKIANLDVFNANIEKLTAFNATIKGILTAVKATIGTLTTNIATIDKLTITHSADIKDLWSGKANITDLTSTNATIKVLEANTAKVETLVNGNLTSRNLQSGSITGDSLNMNTIFVKDANIINVNANKINVGELDTDKVIIKSSDGGIEIVGATQQFKDKNNNIRIQMGKDVKGNFNFIIKGEDGATTLIDHTGIKSDAIADDLINNNMIASDAVGEKQINYSSFSEGFNSDSNGTFLKSTKILLDNYNQTLEIAFNSLKKQSDNNKNITEINSTTIDVMQGKIAAAINNTQIIKDGKTILLKDAYNRTVATINSIESTIGKYTSQIEESIGKVNNVENIINMVKRDLEGMEQKVSSTNISSIQDLANKNKVNITNTNNKMSTLETTLNGINSKVSKVVNSNSTIEGIVNSFDTRLNSAEEKITENAIINTVVNSRTYRSDLNGKISAENIISTINQTAERIKIKANKIQLEGSTTVGGQCRHIRISDHNMLFYENSTEFPQDLRLEIGFQENDFRSGTCVPKIRMGCYGMNPEAGKLDEGNYILINHFPRNANPEGVDSDLFSITHRNRYSKNWNGYRSYGDGTVKLLSGDNEIYLEGKNGVRINKLNIYDLSPSTLGLEVGSILMHCALDGNGKNLGWSGSRFNQVCASTGEFRNVNVDYNLTCDVVTTRALGSNNEILMHASLNGNGKNLGWSGSKFNQVSARSIWGDSGNVSDISLKENIRYLDPVKVKGKNIEVMPPILKENPHTESEFIDVTKDDLFIFIKDELKLCEFNYIDKESTKTQFDYKVGFIANDVEGTKVGNKFIHMHEGILGYNINTLLFITIGALQKEIKKREELEIKLNKLVGGNYE